MVSIGIRLIQPLTAARVIVLVTMTLAVTACFVVPGQATLPVPESAIVDVGDDRAAARLADGNVQVLVETSDGVSIITSSPARRGETTVNLMSYGGDTKEEWNTFVYGTAPNEVDRVELDWPGAVGGDVVDGAWLIALTDKDVTPDQLRWLLLGDTGVEIGSGTGIVTLER